jgi:hypothetical protein
MRLPVLRIAAAVAVLCLLVGFFLSRQKAQESRPEAISSSSSGFPAIGRTVANPTTPRRSTSLPAVPAADQSPAPTATTSSVPASATEVNLPAPPSGDFELAATKEEIKALVEMRYGELLRALALPQERQDRFRALLIERQEVTIDAANAAILFGLNPVRDLPAIQRAIEQFQSPIDTTLRNEFGESVFAAYRDFDQTIRERNSVTLFARQLAAFHEALRPEQEKQMMQILKKFPGPDFPTDIDGVIYGRVRERARIGEQAVAAAAEVLSPRQLEVFRQLAQREPSENAPR